MDRRLLLPLRVSTRRDWLSCQGSAVCLVILGRASGHGELRNRATFCVRQHAFCVQVGPNFTYRPKRQGDSPFVDSVETQNSTSDQSSYQRNLYQFNDGFDFTRGS